MKQILTLLLCLSALAGVAQIWIPVQVQYIPDGQEQSFTWYVVYHGDTIASKGADVGTPYTSNPVVQFHTLYLPQDCVEIIMHNDSCEGFNDGLLPIPYNFAMWKTLYDSEGNPVYISIVGLNEDSDYACEFHEIINPATLTSDCLPVHECNECIGDFNGDMIVGVADLMIFISVFGSTCIVAGY